MLRADDNVNLSNNYFSALVQLKSLDKHLNKANFLRLHHQKKVSDALEFGYFVQIKPHDPKTSRNREWYLPHLPVTNPDKSGKVQKRLNGASKFHGFSLNKSLLVGTHLLQGLQFVLLRFLQHKFVISADIEGKFLQVGTLPEEQPSLPFQCREEPSTEVMVYQYTLHIFGGHDSPTCANFALQQTT